MIKRLFLWAGVLLSLASILTVYAGGITTESAPTVHFLGVLNENDAQIHGLYLTASALYLSHTPRDLPPQLLEVELASQNSRLLWEAAENPPTALTPTQDGTQLAFFSHPAVYLLDIATATTKALYTVANDEQAVLSLAFNPAGTHLAVGRRDGNILVLDATTGELGEILASADPYAAEEETDEEAVQTLAFLPDGRLVSGHESGIVRLWSGAEMTTEWQAHRRALRDLLPSPDGQLLATQGKDNQLRLWDISTGEEIFARPSTASTLAFNPAGNLLAGGGKSLFIWEVATGTLLYRDFHSNRRISAVNAQFSPDGHFLVSGSRYVTLWGLEAGFDLLSLTDDRAAAGYDLYQQNGCNGCHFEYPSGAPTLYGLGEVAGERIAGMSAEDYIYEGIVDPDAYIPGNYPRGIHPTFYGDKLSYEEVWMLVAYILSLRPSPSGH